MERFWSFMNKFVSMTRHMNAGNRRLLLTDAVCWYNNTRTEQTGKYHLILADFILLMLIALTKLV